MYDLSFHIKFVIEATSWIFFMKNSVKYKFLFKIM